MLNWVVRHIDAIEDNIQRLRHTEKYYDWEHIKEVIKLILGILNNGIAWIIKFAVSFISIFVTWLMLWCLFRG